MSKNKAKEEDKTIIFKNELAPLRKIEVVGDLSEYVAEFVKATNPLPEADAVIITVDADKDMSSKDYLKLGHDIVDVPPETQAYIYVNFSNMSTEQRSLVNYLQGIIAGKDNVSMTNDIDLLLSWL